MKSPLRRVSNKVSIGKINEWEDRLKALRWFNEAFWESNRLNAMNNARSNFEIKWWWKLKIGMNITKRNWVEKEDWWGR